MQIYICLSPGDYGPVEHLCHCNEQRNGWMHQTFLQLKRDQTDIIVFGPRREKQSVGSHLRSLHLITNNFVFVLEVSDQICNVICLLPI